MSGFENFAKDAREIELELERKGIALGIDWTDDAEVRALAREAVNRHANSTHLTTSEPIDHHQMAKIDLFGLAAIMLRTMEKSAMEGFESHGGVAWKAFAKALWAESNQG